MVEVEVSGEIGKKKNEKRSRSVVVNYKEVLIFEWGCFKISVWLR